MSNEQDIATQVMIGAAQELVKSTYNDLIHPAAKVTGEVVALLPRAIHAALVPLEKWIINREFNRDELIKLLALKLEKVSPENIVPLEAYVGVPALQQISYCTDNEELRNMYANLLARAMNKDAKDSVHPSFAEVIKQLSPSEALLLKYIYTEHVKDNQFCVSAVSIFEINQYGSQTQLVDRFFSIPNEINYEEHNSKIYFDNLVRLQLLQKPMTGFRDERMDRENNLERHPYIFDIMNNVRRKNIRSDSYDIRPPSYHAQVQNIIYDTTSYGISFAEACILE